MRLWGQITQPFQKGFAVIEWSQTYSFSNFKTKLNWIVGIFLNGYFWFHLQKNVTSVQLYNTKHLSLLD